MTSSIVSTPPKLRRSTVLLYSFLFTDLASSTFHRQVFGRKVSAVWDLGLASKILWNFLECSQALHPWCLKKKITPSWTRITSQIRAQNDTKFHTLKSASPTTGAVGRTFVWLLKKLCRCIVADSGFFGCWNRGFLMFFGLLNSVCSCEKICSFCSLVAGAFVASQIFSFRALDLAFLILVFYSPKSCWWTKTGEPILK